VPKWEWQPRNLEVSYIGSSLGWHLEKGTQWDMKVQA